MLFASAKDLERTERLLSGYAHTVVKDKASKAQDASQSAPELAKELFGYAGMNQIQARSYLVKVGLGGLAIVLFAVIFAYTKYAPDGTV